MLTPFGLNVDMNMPDSEGVAGGRHPGSREACASQRGREKAAHSAALQLQAAHAGQDACWQGWCVCLRHTWCAACAPLAISKCM
jgi:hypothetical protein